MDLLAIPQNYKERKTSLLHLKQSAPLKHILAANKENQSSRKKRRISQSAFLPKHCFKSLHREHRKRQSEAVILEDALNIYRATSQKRFVQASVLATRTIPILCSSPSSIITGFRPSGVTCERCRKSKCVRYCLGYVVALRNPHERASLQENRLLRTKRRIDDLYRTQGEENASETMDKICRKKLLRRNRSLWKLPVIVEE